MSGEKSPKKWVRLYDARIYREMIGGERGTEVDREILHALEEAAQVDSRPWVENRGFLVRAVTHLARDAGVDQYLDVGAGLPAWGDVHEVARRYRPGAAVAYIDHDQEVVDAWRAVAAERGPMCSVYGDVRKPWRIVENPEVRALLDFDRPVALLLTAVLNLVSPDHDRPEIVRTLMGALPSGSHLVYSEVSDEGQPPEPFALVRKVVEDLGAGFPVWSRAEIARVFEGLDLLEPGVVPVADWRPVHPPSRVSGWFVGGVARKR